MDLKLIATATFGLEAVTAKELERLGYEDFTVENGKVTFDGDETDIAICNTWLRTADRVLIQMAQFEARDFEELYQGTLKVNWGGLIPENGVMHVTGKSIKSVLHSVPDCQSIVKKAVIQAMKKKYSLEKFPEDGPVYKIEVGILKDVVTLTIDTTGPGLHKRGYRALAGEAPIKETLAAALILLSDWKPSKVLADPFCGSGTIVIEAAMIGLNMAPGLKRKFVCEEWPTMPAGVWKQVREGALKAIKKEEFRILASDIDSGILRIARDNAEMAGVSENVAFQTLPLEKFSSAKKKGCIITNPPYGERVGDKKLLEDLYKDFGRVYRTLDSWSCFVITSFEGFESFFGQRAGKNRKLYNGRIQCYFYQYFSNSY